MLGTNVNKLRGKMAEKKVYQEDLARAIGVDGSTIYRKLLTDGLKFSIEEAHKVSEFLELTQEEAVEIFLCKN